MGMTSHFYTPDAAAPNFYHIIGSIFCSCEVQAQLFNMDDGKLYPSLPIHEMPNNIQINLHDLVLMDVINTRVNLQY